MIKQQTGSNLQCDRPRSGPNLDSRSFKEKEKVLKLAMRSPSLRPKSRFQILKTKRKTKTKHTTNKNNKQTKQRARTRIAIAIALSEPINSTKFILSHILKQCLRRSSDTSSRCGSDQTNQVHSNHTSLQPKTWANWFIFHSN